MAFQGENTFSNTKGPKQGKHIQTGSCHHQRAIRVEVYSVDTSTVTFLKKHLSLVSTSITSMSCQSYLYPSIFPRDGRQYEQDGPNGPQMSLNVLPPCSTAAVRSAEAVTKRLCAGENVTSVRRCVCPFKVATLGTWGILHNLDLNHKWQATSHLVRKNNQIVACHPQSHCNKVSRSIHALKCSS